MILAEGKSRKRFFFFFEGVQTDRPPLRAR